MNCKLEKFWNNTFGKGSKVDIKWTVNLKSFEITNIVSLYLHSLYEL